MKGYVTVGLAVLAGAALFEAALIPGLVIGGAAVLAPRYLSKLRRRRQPASSAAARTRSEPAVPLPDRVAIKASPADSSGLRIKQAVAKTITFRIIVTTLDFSTNYLVIGELATAAGLSAFALVAGPLFYLLHEAGWNYFGPAGTAVRLPVLRGRPGATTPQIDGEGRAISRALAKTITFRTIATTMDFTANYVVVGDLATAAGLSAFGFVVGPFVYFGHERVWEYYGSPGEGALDVPAPMKHLPAPG